MSFKADTVLCESVIDFRSNSFFLKNHNNESQKMKIH
jgi:hypothetical protein